MYEPNDPTRIPRVLEALQRAWEGQPDLTLTALMGILGNRGVGWGSSDAELVDALSQLEHQHPSLIDAEPPHHLSIETTSPDRLVTLAGDIVVVRDARRHLAMPSVWRYESLRRTGPGRPLVVRDVEGIEHRLGVVKLATRLPAGAHSIGAIRRTEIGGRRWLVALEGGGRAVVGRKVTVWEQSRREVTRREIAWASLRCEVGADMEIAPADGGDAVELGRVDAIVALEVD